MRRILSVLMALLLVCSIPLSALAIEVNVSYGDVTIGDTQVTHTDADNNTKTEDHGGSVTVKGETNEYAITVNTDTDVTVTLDNVTVDHSNYDGAAGMKVTTGEDAKVTVELEGTNTLTGGREAAGLQTEYNMGSLEIADSDNDGSLIATGGTYGAGIGGGGGNWTSDTTGSNITISGGKITAIGGGTDPNEYYSGGAGIGGGGSGNGENILISGGEVTAVGGETGAGIGGGSDGMGSNITISGGEVTAIGGERGAGIGAGYCNIGTDIVISGGKVTATGGNYASGIGGGGSGDGDSYGENITISGGIVTATGGNQGAGIGGGCYGDGVDITISGGNVTATGGECATGIGGGHDGIGSNIVIEDDAVVDARGNGLAEDIGSCPKPLDSGDNDGDGAGDNTDGEPGGESGSNAGGVGEATREPEPVGGFYYSRGRILNSHGVNVQSLFDFDFYEWEETVENGDVVITAPEEDKVVITVWAMRYMMEVGIETLSFNGSKLILKDAVADLTAGDTYTITATAIELNGNPV